MPLQSDENAPPSYLPPVFQPLPDGMSPPSNESRLKPKNGLKKEDLDRLLQNPEQEDPRGTVGISSWRLPLQSFYSNLGLVL